MSESKYAIGVDLGTTHSALAYVDLALSEGEEVVEAVLGLPQTVAPGEVEARPLLPSFLYLPHPDEFTKEALALPFDPAPSRLVGELARSRGAETPIRLVSSAKSWLCHPDVDRRAPILPTDAPDEVAKVSPVEASIAYLEHIRKAWDAVHPDAPLATQDVTLTVPASFDPAARELTAEAAKAAGYERLVLLEEPQAALYAWIEGKGRAWRDELKVGDVILVVDVGGGTTDLSLIAVLERGGNLELHRIAVGDHILLGGDNMDLALAHVLKQKLEAEGRTLDAWQVRALTYGCRVAKEQLLAGHADAVPVVVPSRGSKLVGGSIRAELTRAEVEEVLVRGFFPIVAANARPVTRARTALTQLGLPYAQDAGITRHLAGFVSRHAYATKDLEGFPFDPSVKQSFLHPTAVLFNGGVLKAGVFAERVMEVVNTWLTGDGAQPARMLHGADLDRGVARGAAYYGYVRRGGGVRIRGGLAQAYYVGVEAAMPAVPGMEPPIHAICVAPFGLEVGSPAEMIPLELGLVVGEPVRFRFFASSVRRDDRVGTTLERWSNEELVELGAIEATLPAEGRQVGDVVPVRLGSEVTEVGTLVLVAVPRQGDARWKVELDVRGDR